MKTVYDYDVFNVNYMLYKYEIGNSIRCVGVLL